MASLLEQYGWYEWLTHSNFSFKIGASHPIELVTQAASAGYRGLGLADFDGVYGLARCHQALKSLKKAQPDTALRLFYGAEFHLRDDHHLPIVLQDTVVLIAQSARGYKQLCQLASYSHRQGKNAATLPLAHLSSAAVSELVAIQPMRGLLNHRGLEEPWRLKAEFLREVFGRKRFFLAVSRHLHPSEDHGLRPTLELARRLGVDGLLTQDAFFHSPNQKDLSDLLQAIRTNQTMDEAVGHHFVNAERCLRGLKQLEARFAKLPIYESALAASARLAASCRFDLAELRYHYPKEMLPEGYSAQAYLVELTWIGTRQRYGESPPERLTPLLQRELALVEELQFADYFLTVWDIVRWARERGILCQGRGSAANSAVCFVLGITAIDPAHFDLLFERFISAERGDPPDIDVDFEHERREEVIQYIYERYGRAQAAMVANVITFQRRGALRAVGKALGVPELVLGKAAALLSSRAYRRGDTEQTLAELQRVLVADGLMAAPDAWPWPHWVPLAARLDGFPSHLGIHSGGFIIADQALDALVAQEPATMPGRSVIQWNKEDIEALGFFKIDVLALGMLTAIRKCFELIAQHYGKQLTLATIPPGDEATYDMICRADTVGTFQIESRAQMSMLPRLKPRCFYDLVIEVAIIRPGPIQGGMIHPFLRRRAGLEPVTFPDPRLRPILERTLGIPIFQEQVMRIAMAVGGFSAGEADELRRHIGSFAMKGDVSRWLGRLSTGMQANGIPEPFIEAILAQLKGFASYGFPESHSASFALLAYASSYLKCHYPAAFFTALLNSQPMGFYTPHVLLQTARHLGITVLPVCVEASQWDHQLERVAAGGKQSYGIRMGLRLVRSLREEAARALVAQRQRRTEPPANLLAFVQSQRLSRLDLTALAAANALRHFGVDRRAALWLAEAAPFCEYLEDVEPPVEWADETSAERMQSDFHATATSLGPHPASIFKEEAWCYEWPTKDLCLARELAARRPGQQLVVFGMVIVRQAPPSAKGMVFLTVEDDTGLINLVVTPQIYALYRHLLDRQALLCVRGLLQKQGDAHSLRVTYVWAPTVAAADVIAMAARPREGSDSLTEKALAPSRNYC